MPIPKIDTAYVGSPVSVEGLSIFPVFLDDVLVREVATGPGCGLVAE